MHDFLLGLLPAAILALLILAPRRGGRPRPAGAGALALFVAIWAVVALGLGMLWNCCGLALLAWMSGSG